MMAAIMFVFSEVVTASIRSLLATREFCCVGDGAHGCVLTASVRPALVSGAESAGFADVVSAQGCLRGAGCLVDLKQLQYCSVRDFPAEDQSM